MGRIHCNKLDPSLFHVGITMHRFCGNSYDFENTGTGWLHAATIAQVGIQLESGRKLSDFGPQCFYMSRSLNSAIEWAHKIGGNEAAIVVYRSEWISTVEQLHVFDGPTDEWKETVHGFLNDKTMSIFKDKYS